MSTKYVHLKEENGLCWIRFNRPEKLNAVNPEVLAELENALIICEQYEQIKVVILTGSEKAFIAGADIGNMANAGIRDAIELTDLTMRVQERLADLPKPTIASVAGFALGAGCETALCCDFRIAAENALFGLPEIKLGIIPGGGGTQRLPRLVNPSAAARMILLGENVNAIEAANIGLVDKVVVLDQLESETVSFATRLMRMPPLAVRAARTAMRKGLNTSLKDGLEIEKALFCSLFGTLDQKEGMSAFLEKRKPSFIGR
ncbi:MAG: enoyl-CoA hydratase/isomerase family protein [Syntrophobacteraceae bacterium]